MPTPTYSQIASITLASSASEVFFTSISNQYKDLALVANASVLDGTRTLLMGMNDDTSSGVYWVVMTGDGTNKYSQQADWVQLYTTYAHYNLTTTPSIINVDMIDYSATDKHKSFLVRSSNSSDSASALAGRQASTAPIRKLRLYPNGSSFASGSTFTLYGIVG
jgi:hypothetical protein